MSFSCPFLAAGQKLAGRVEDRKQYNTDYIEVETDNVVIISDLEIPDVDPLMLELAYLTGKKYGIKKLIIAGDFMATDQQALNDWVNIWKESREATYDNTRKAATATLKSLLTTFDDVYMVRGNHDDRINRKTGGEVHIGMFFDHIEGVQYSQYAYMFLKTSGGPVYVCHPTGKGSSISVALGQKFYNTVTSPEKEKCHVVLGHTHHAQTGWSPDGLMEIHALGCMRDPEKTKYLMVNATPQNQWSQGFLMIRNGYFHNLTRQGTDWEFMLGDLCPPGLIRKARYGVQTPPLPIAS